MSLRMLESGGYLGTEDATLRGTEGADASAVVVYEDDFNRADSSNMGAPWVNFEGYISISNNKATQPDTNLHTSYYDRPFAADQWSEADVVWDTGGAMSCLCVRFNGANGDLYYTWRNSLNFAIYKRQGWSWSQVGSDGPAVTLGVQMKVRLEAEGTTIRMYVDGALVITADDPSGMTDGQAGLLASNGMGATYDNWRGGNLPFPGPA